MLEFESCAIIDAQTLNVLYKYKNRFSLALNYSSCPERLTIDLNSLPVGSNVYISLYPRQTGEGNYTIEPLIIGSVGFDIDVREIMSLYSLIYELPNIESVYICNKLASINNISRVSDYNLTFRYGTRVGVCKVSNSLLESIKVFDSMPDFLSYYDDSEINSMYGEEDIIDKARISSQYPELSNLFPHLLSNIAPLVMSIQSSCKINIKDILPKLEDILKEEKSQASLHLTAMPSKITSTNSSEASFDALESSLTSLESTNDDPVDDISKEKAKKALKIPSSRSKQCALSKPVKSSSKSPKNLNKSPKNHHKQHTPIKLLKLPIIGSFILSSALIGIAFSVNNFVPQLQKILLTEEGLISMTQTALELSDTYSQSSLRSTFLVSLQKYLNNPQLGVKMVSVSPSGADITVELKSSEEIVKFEEYLTKEYTLSSRESSSNNIVIFHLAN